MCFDVCVRVRFYVRVSGSVSLFLIVCVSISLFLCDSVLVCVSLCLSAGHSKKGTRKQGLYFQRLNIQTRSRCYSQHCAVSYVFRICVLPCWFRGVKVLIRDTRDTGKCCGIRSCFILGGGGGNAVTGLGVVL